MRHARFLILVLASVGLGCGAVTPQPTTRDTRILRDDGAEPILIQTEGSTVENGVPASADRTWDAVMAVYEELEIPYTRIQPAARMIENGGFRTRRIDGQRMSRFFDCGSTVTGPIANTYQVTISIRSTVIAEGEAFSTVVTDLDASAQARDVRSGALHCSSTGRLERLIWERVLERTG